MNKPTFPQDYVFWNIRSPSNEKLTKNITTDVLIVGGGIAGLSAAQNFNEKKLSVVLIEKNFCGSGASGRSSGFITPDSELGLGYFVDQFGEIQAKKIWDFGTLGANLIENNIKKFSINCDYQKQDVLVVANSDKAFNELKEDNEIYKKLSFANKLYEKNDLSRIIGSDKYFGGITFPNTFGINCYQYCQKMKEILQQRGVKIYENTPAIKINNDNVETDSAKINAKYIVVCVDRFLPELNKLKSDVYQAQTFLMISEPLQENEIKKIFPEKNYMVWDTDLIYQYYRIVDGNRFLIGGSDLLAIFSGREQHNLKRMYKKLNKYTKEKFPDVKINFEYMWPGLIGTSKDVMPVACADENNENIYYVSCAAGLPWAAALGWYSAEKLINKHNDLDKYFSPRRKYPVPDFVQKILGKRITFSLSNFINLYFKNLP